MSLSTSPSNLVEKFIRQSIESGALSEATSAKAYSIQITLEPANVKTSVTLSTRPVEILPIVVASALNEALQTQVRALIQSCALDHNGNILARYSFELIRA